MIKLDNLKNLDNTLEMVCGLGNFYIGNGLTGPMYTIISMSNILCCGSGSSVYFFGVNQRGIMFK